MTCQELEQFLLPYLDGEFESVERTEAERHFASCHHCSKRLNEESTFRNSLRVGHTKAPDALRKRVSAGFKRERTRTARLRWGAMAAGVMVVSAAGTAWVYRQPAPSHRFVDDAAARHAKRLPFEIQVPSYETVEAWFGGKLDHRVPVPRFPNATVAGARLSNVQHKQAAYISYDAARGQAQHRLGLFVFHDTAEEVEAPPFPSVRVSATRGYNVAVWRDGEIVYELVSDLNESDIRDMLQRHDMPRPTPSMKVQPASYVPQ